MRRFELRDRLVVGAMLLALILTISLVASSFGALRSFSDAFLVEGGLWGPTQLERELLRYREVLYRASLGDPTLAANDYTLRHDIAASRVAASYELLGSADKMFLTPDEIASTEQIRALWIAHVASVPSGPGASITQAQATAAIAGVDELVELARISTNQRRQQLQNIGDERDAVIGRLEASMGAMFVLLLVEAAGVFWLTRKRFDTSLQAAYSALSERTQALESSERQQQQANEMLQRQNAVLSRTLEELEASAHARSSLEQTMLRMQLPVIPVLEGVAVMPIVGTLSIERLRQATELLLERVQREHTRYALLDVTGSTITDPASIEELVRLFRALHLLGCTPLLVGVTPEVAEALAASDFHRSGTAAYSSLQQALGSLLGRAPHS